MKQILLTMILVLLWPSVVWAHPSLEGTGWHVCETDCAKWGLVDGERHDHMSDGSYTNSQGDLFNAEGVKIDSVTPSYPTTEPEVFINPITAPEPVLIAPDSTPTEDVPAPTNADSNAQPEVMESTTAPTDADGTEPTPRTTTQTVLILIGWLAVIGIAYWIVKLMRR